MCSDDRAAVFWDGTLLRNQTAIPALLFVVLQPPDSVFSLDRFLNALVGDAVTLLIY